MRDNKTRITKVRKNEDGDITDIMTDTGEVYSIDEAITMAKNHTIEAVNVGKSKSGREFLRSNPNSEKNDNLDEFPTF